MHIIFYFINILARFNFELHQSPIDFSCLETRTNKFDYFFKYDFFLFVLWNFKDEVIGNLNYKQE